MSTLPAYARCVMALPEERIRALAQLIADHVPLEKLADTVAEETIVTNFDTLVQEAVGAPANKHLAIALDVVKRYDARNHVESLISRLRRRMGANDFFNRALADFDYDDDSASNLEAAIAKRARTIRLRGLRTFLDEHEPRICVIAGVAQLPNGLVRFPRGTGFLAAADLVITARHVLRYHIHNGAILKPSPGPLYAFFDHLDGAPILDPRDPTIAARRVEFHSDWLQDFSDFVVGDGKTPDPLTKSQIDACAQNLDMVLIKLAEPIGAYSRWNSGGLRRGWVSFPDETVPAGLAPDDRIVIPQHPKGEAQQIDFGRYKKTDSSQTRIRYDTETDRGTSGAPCFNQHFALVGMHHAAFRPPTLPHQEYLNQAIRFDHILRRIKPRIPPAPVGDSSRLWSVADDPAKPEVIIGRAKLLRWIEDAMQTNLAKREQRVYVAQALRPKCGASFTVRILRAALRGKADPVIVMGTQLQRVPKTPLDFISVLAEHLKLSTAISPTPERAGSNIPNGSPDGDKTNLWSARDLPDWLTKTLRSHRTVEIDARTEARAEIERYQNAGLAPDPEDVLIANADKPQLITEQRWERIWIVVDNASDAVFEKEVGELIAALIGTPGEADSAFNPELRRIRWLFLGSKPTFISEACIETLDQMQLPDADIQNCIEAFALSFNKKPKQQFLNDGVGFVRVSCLKDDAVALFEDEKTRLPLLQKLIADLRNYFRKVLGV